jgi:hypothetical protein
MSEEPEIVTDLEPIDAGNSTDIAGIIYDVVSDLSFAKKESIIKIVAGLVEMYHENTPTTGKDKGGSDE